MKYKLAIFDMDGTILDTLEDLADATNFSLGKHHFPERSIDEVRRFVGNGIHKLVERAVPEGTDAETIEAVFQTFNEYYKDHCAIKTRPYEGIHELLRRLRANGVLTAVVSNKADYAVKSLCVDYFDGLFDFSAGDLAGRRRKPYPDVVNAVLGQFGIDRMDAVYIGDSEVDIETARNAGMDAIIVGWGFRDEDFLMERGAGRVVHGPEDILAVMEVDSPSPLGENI